MIRGMRFNGVLTNGQVVVKFHESHIPTYKYEFSGEIDFPKMQAIIDAASLGIEDHGFQITGRSKLAFSVWWHNQISEITVLELAKSAIEKEVELW